MGTSFSSANFLSDFSSRPPSYAWRSAGSPYLIVGKPRTPFESQSGLPSAVQSTSATSFVGWSAYSAMTASHAGFIFLQWPHQGARNLMKTVFPEVAASQLSGVRSRGRRRDGERQREDGASHGSESESDARGF